jgi:hypothetical protein
MAGTLPRRSARAVALLAALALAAAACSSGDAVRPSAGEDLPKDAHDREIVESGLLRITDFAAGWSTDLRNDDDGGGVNPTDSIPECAGLQQINDAGSLGKADSPDFTTPQDKQASNNVEIYVDTAKVDEIQALVESPDAVACFQKGLTATLEKELAKDDETAAVVRGVTVNGGPIDAGSFGDATDALGYHAAVDLGVMVLNFYFDVVVVKVGRTQASFMFMDDLPNPVADERDPLIQASVDRLRAAGA